MAMKAFLGAWGLVSVGASECTNTTLPHAQPSTDVAVDSLGNVWYTTNGDGANDDGGVWMCAKGGRECRLVMGLWSEPVAIAVTSKSTLFYVAVGPDTAAKVLSCRYRPDDNWVSCKDFGSGWRLPRGLALDSESNVYVTDIAGDHQGVWKCSPSADCTLFGDSDGWQHFPPNNVAVDSQGTVYVTSGYAYDPIVPLKRCTSAGLCVDGPVPFDFAALGITVALDPDDNIYIGTASIDHSGRHHNVFRCPLGQEPCEPLGAFDAGARMAIDEDGVFYVVNGHSVRNIGIHRVCLSPVTTDAQV